MRDLPKFAILINSVGFKGMKVICLEPPYILANLYHARAKEIEEVSSFMDDFVQKRFPMSKVDGYTIFLRVYSSLEPCNDPEYQQQILDEMADFILAERINSNLGQFRKYCESDKWYKPNDSVPQVKTVKLRERRERIKKD